MFFSSYFTDYYPLISASSIEVAIAHLEAESASGRPHGHTVFCLTWHSDATPGEWNRVKRLLKLAERSLSPVLLAGFGEGREGCTEDFLVLQVPILSIGRLLPMADVVLPEDSSKLTLAGKLDELSGMSLESLLNRRTERFLAQGREVAHQAVLAEIRVARADDIHPIHGFFQPFVEKQQILPRSEAEIGDSLENFLVAVKAGTEELIGTVALRDFGGGLFEVRSLTVSPACEGQGLGSRLVKAAVAHAKSRGAVRIFTLTMRPGLFRRCGFNQVCIMRFPGKVQVDCLNCPKKEHCDEVALCLDVDGANG